MHYKCCAKNYLIDLDLDVHLDLFETGVTEASISVSVGVDVRHHEPATSTFHVPSSGNILRPELATSSTSSVATAENSRIRVPGGVQDDFELCTEFVQKTCGCTKANGKPCSMLFSVDHYFEHRSQASLLTRQELDLVLLGSIMTTVLDRDSIVDGRHKPAKRSKVSSCHMHNGYKVCKSTYAFLFGVGTKHKLENIKKHYLEHGMDIRVHKNTRRLPPKTLSFADITSLVKFIENYAEQHAILLPGRIPGYKKDDIKLLPCSTSKKVQY